jgi:hypothetical protein
VRTAGLRVYTLIKKKKNSHIQYKKIQTGAVAK